MAVEEYHSGNPIDIINLLKSKNEALRKENKQLKNANPKQLEYEESQVRFRTVFENSRLGNKILSSDLKILEMNTAMAVLLGYESKEEIIGTEILEYVPPECHHDWKILQEKLWRRRIPSFSLESCLIRKNGSTIWCHVTSILFQDKGETLGYTIIEDVTEQHNLRIQKEAFLSVASHELKTPITSIKAVLQLMNHMIKSETSIPEKIVKLANDAELYTTKLTNLVNDLLNTTHIEQGQLNINRSNFMLLEVLKACCNHIRFDDIHHISHTGEESLEVYADKQKIDQVLVNLVNNAVRYAPDSKEIIIHIEHLDNKAKVSVTDQGKGISPENLSQLFDRYYMVNKASNSSGLGLGLFISSEIIKKHGGEIGVESELEKGSTFWFTLPLSQDDYSL